MTNERAEKYIRWSIAGNSDDNFRPNEHLHLFLRLVHNSRVKPAYIYRLTPSDINRNDNGTGEGVYVTMRSGLYEYVFDIEKEDMDLLEAYIEKYQVKKDEPILQIGERAIRKVFNEIAEEYREDGKPRDRIKDFYNASN